MDRGSSTPDNAQTFAASPAEPGELPLGFSRDPATAHLTTADWQLVGPVVAAAGTPSGALARAKEGVTPVPDPGQPVEF